MLTIFWLPWLPFGQPVVRECPARLSGYKESKEEENARAPEGASQVLKIEFVDGGRVL